MNALCSTTQLCTLVIYALFQVFGLIEQNKVDLFIEDYSVSQTTLEQVFINFARAQRPPADEIDCGKGCGHGGCCC